MALVLKTAKGPPAARDATPLLEAQADLWSQRPGCRTRRLQIQYTAALLRWAVSQKALPAQWAPPPDLSTIIGRSRESRAVTTPIAVPVILAMVQAIPDPRWRFAFQLLSAFGLRPEERQHLQLRQQYEAQGENLVLYSCRHSYAHRAHVICDLPPKVVALETFSTYAACWVLSSMEGRDVIGNL